MEPKLSIQEANGVFTVASQDGSPVSPEADELNKIFGRIEAEKAYSCHAEIRVKEIAECLKTGINDNALNDSLKKAREVEKNFEAERSKLKKRPFTVFGMDKEGEPIEPSDRTKKICDILIRTEDMPISDEKIAFKVEVDRTIMVIDQVLKPEGNQGRRGLGRILDWHPSPPRGTRQKREDYIRDLRGICHVGLEHEDPAQLRLANKSIESFREEFVAREAGTVKNNYLLRLGVWCLVISVITSLVYIYARSRLPITTIHYYRNFLILVAGAGVGTWLSFALRRQTLNFLDLATLEEDRLDPIYRVLFVAALASVVGLLISTSTIIVGAGQFSTALLTNGAVALLFGVLLGIAERTMATAVQKRASEFSTGIGGK